MDLTTLFIFKDSFIEKELQEYFSDILYKVEIKGEPAWIYLLFEHKSYPDPFVAFQLLRYMVKIWELLLNQKQIHKEFPVIIPLVIYHGREKWGTGENFSHLFSPQDKALFSYIPGFDYILYDLSHFTDDQIKGAVTLRAFLLLLKYIFHEEFREQLFKMPDLFKELASKASGMEYLEAFLRYIISATDKITEQDIKDILIKTLPQGGDTIMPTLAEKWIEQGIQQGMEKGIQQGMEKGIQQGMEKGIQQGMEKGIQQGMEKGIQQGMEKGIQRGMEKGIQRGMQQGMEKGIQQGLLEAIQLGLELKFGAQGLAHYPDISKIEDIAQLRAIKETIVIAKDIEEVKGLIKR